MAMEIEMCSYLPLDIIFQLLLLFPVKSLVQFKSVCKTWCSIISHRQFIETHKNQTSSLEKTVLVVVRDTREFVQNLYLINTPTNTAPELVTEIRLPQRFGREIRFVGHCNGLVCLSNERGNVIYLWNPSTNQYKVLPRPKIRKTKSRFTTMLGFGFDSISDDYKVLSFGLSRVSPDRKVPKAEMYSANADSWVELEVRNMFTRFCHMYSKRFHIKIGEVLYLETYVDIVWFDLRNGAFGVYKIPNSMQAHRKSNIFDFGGSVAAIFESGGYGDESVRSLWALLDDGCGEVSWTKIFNLAPDLDFYKDRLFCFLGGGHFVTLHDDHECIFSDCYEKKEIKVPLVATRKTLVVKYLESLVSLEGFKQLK